MLKRNFVSLTAASCILSSSLFGLTLKESISEALNTNPVVQERLKNYRATQQDLNIAESEYYPKIDIRATAGVNYAGERYDHVRNIDYTNYESSLQLTQNLFDGFGTMHKVDYQEARILAAAYNYVEKSNDIAFKMTNAYLNVLRSYELLETAKENVQINEDIYAKVKDLYDSGLTTNSEVQKVQASLSLARSNLTVQKTNSKDVEYNFKRILGRMPDRSEMKRPSFDFPMPESIERAAMYSIKHNPSLLVSRYNIKGAQALWKQRDKEFYPKLDLEVNQFYNDSHIDTNGFDQPDDRFRARLVLTYNLFSGGKDKAEFQKNISKIAQETEIKRDLKRQVIEGLELSWNAYENISKQLVDLRKYSKFSEETLKLNEQEYDLGRRSLLDLLSSQNDVINSRTQIITAQYDYLFAKYRILDAMGLLVTAVAGDETKYTSRVNLYGDADAKEVLDTVPVELDVDKDHIADDIDLCDNSALEDNIMPYGCKKIALDSDNDGVIDSKDQCPLTAKGLKVSANGCELDTDEDGVVDSQDKCQNTPKGYKVDIDGCSISLSLNVKFSENSAVVPKSASGEIDKFADFLAQNSRYNILIIGHTNNRGNADYNLKLSKKRAKAIELALIKRGVDKTRIKSEGRGDTEPIADNNTPDGLKLNRRVEVELSKEI